MYGDLKYTPMMVITIVKKAATLATLSLILFIDTGHVTDVLFILIFCLRPQIYIISINLVDIKDKFFIPSVSSSFSGL